MKNKTVMEANKTIGWEVCFSGYSTFKVQEYSDYILVEVTRSWDEMMFDEEHFDVVVEFEYGKEKDPLVYVHEAQAVLKPEETDMINMFIRDYLNKSV
jgi:hypothetical protein